MKVSITGATGFLGGRLCDTCLSRGHEVRALARNPVAADHLAARGVKVVRGNILDDECLRSLCAGADVVFNVAGALGKWGTQRAELEDINARAPAILAACAGESGVGRLVHTSTAGVSGPLQPGVRASEDHPQRPATDYQSTKLAGEKAVLSAHDATGIPVTIVRPTFVYGPRDMHKLSLFRAISRRRMILVNRGTSRLHPAYVDDVVEGMILAAERAPGRGEVYILGGDEPATTRELTEVIAHSLGAPPPRISLPEGVLLGLASAVESAGRLVGKEPPVTRSRVKLLSENYAYSIDKARSELGFRPSTDLPTGVRQAVSWYREHGLLD